jgi:hypothetical protein
VKKLIKALVLPAMLVVCIAQLSWAVTPSAGGSLSGSVAEYNAAQLIENHGLLTVPAGKVAYTAGTAIPVGTHFVVSLPAGMQFTTPTLPSLSSSAATFTLLSSNGSTAAFQVATSSIVASSTIVLGTYSVKNANALETVTSVASALPLSMQAIGIDPNPLTFPEFASDSGVQAVFVGAIQFIDLSRPSNGSKFGTGTDDSPLAVISAIAISPEIVDFANSTTPVLSPSGQPNNLNSNDTATVEIPGALFGNITAFSSYVSSCTTTLTQGTVTPNALIFPNIPLNREIFFCVQATGSQMIKMLGYPDASYFGAGPSLVAPRLLPSRFEDDFLPSTNVNNEFPGLMCYSYFASGGYGENCVDEYFNLLAPQNYAGN